MKSMEQLQREIAQLKERERIRKEKAEGKIYLKEQKQKLRKEAFRLKHGKKIILVKKVGRVLKTTGRGLKTMGSGLGKSMAKSKALKNFERNYRRNFF